MIGAGGGGFRTVNQQLDSIVIQASHHREAGYAAGAGEIDSLPGQLLCRIAGAVYRGFTVSGNDQLFNTRCVGLSAGD